MHSRRVAQVLRGRERRSGWQSIVGLGPSGFDNTAESSPLPRCLDSQLRRKL